MLLSSDDFERQIIELNHFLSCKTKYIQKFFLKDQLIMQQKFSFISSGM
jgi:hypothetical protein